MSNSITKDDEIDLLELFNVLWHGKWLIILVAVLSGLIAFAWLRITPPIWQADLLLKVESGNVGAALLGNFESILGHSRNQSDTRIEMIKSRNILNQTVKKFDLGKQLSRSFSWQNLLKQKSPIQESKLVFRLGLPRDFNSKDNKLNLYIQDDSHIELQNNGQHILSGEQGKMLEADGYSLFFDGGDQNLAGEVLNIDIADNVQIINKLKEKLSISILDKNGTLLQMRLTGTDPHYIEQLLDDIAHNYVQKVTEQDVEKFAQGVRFIEEQLPSIRMRLEKAEQALRDYQISNETVNLNAEGEMSIRNLAQIEAELTNLTLKENELRSRYTSSHPSLQSIISQRKTLQARKSEIERRLSLVPEATQGLVRLKRDVEVNQTIYLQLIEKLQGLKVIEASTVGDVQIVDNAQSGVLPIKPKKVLVMTVAVFFGVILSSFLLLLLHLMRNRILSIEDVTDNTGLNVIAVVPESKRQCNHEKQLHKFHHKMDENSILSVVDPQDLSIEALRGLRTNLYFSLQNKSNNIILISGPTENVGKSFVSTNLAVLLAQAGQKVVLINGDLRKGYLDLQFKSDEDQKNLSEYLQKTDINMESCIHQTQIKNLSFIPCGNKPKNPAELLGNVKMANLMTFLNEHYDVVLVDTPPILPISDTLQLAMYTDFILLVTRFNRTNIRELVFMQQKILKTNLNILGVVINGVNKKSSKKYVYSYN